MRFLEDLEDKAPEILISTFWVWFAYYTHERLGLWIFVMPLVAYLSDHTGHWLAHKIWKEIFKEPNA